MQCFLKGHNFKYVGFRTQGGGLNDDVFHDVFCCERCGKEELRPADH